MANATVAIIDKPAWVDMSSHDAAASRDFYAKVFGWNVELNPTSTRGSWFPSGQGALQGSAHCGSSRIGPT